MLVLECRNRVGGSIWTEREGPYLLEAGPNSFPSSSQDVLALCEAVGLEPLAAKALQKKRYIALNRQLVAVPAGPMELLTTTLLSWPQKLRFAAEPFMPPLKQEDPSVRDWVSHRLGKAAHDRLAEPFLTGVYAGDTNQLSAKAIFPKLVNAEQVHGSLLRGLLLGKKKRSVPKKRPYQLLNFPQGMAQLPQTVADNLVPGSVLLGQTIDRLQRREGGGYHLTLASGKVVQTRQMIVATSAQQAADVLAPVSPEVAGQLRSLVYEPVTVVYLAYRKEQLGRALDGFGFLRCRAEERKGDTVLGSIWTSALFPERCPDNEVLVSFFFGGTHYREVAGWTATQAVDAAQQAAQWALQLKPRSMPTYSRVFAWEKAIPQYALGHVERVAAIGQALAERLPGVVLAGNYLEGINLNQCVASGMAVAT